MPEIVKLAIVIVGLFCAGFLFGCLFIIKIITEKFVPRWLWIFTILITIFGVVEVVNRI